MPFELALGGLGSLLFLGGSDDKPAEDVRACVRGTDFRDGSSGGGDTCPPKGARKIDGLVQKTDSGGFTIQVIEGTQLGEIRTLHVRKADRPYIDVAHAQTHAALGQPVRVYIEKIDGQDAVVFMEDAPLVQ